ncbi:MAG: restriction endonuclease [Desulfosalsimonadaceae bacterium]
MKYSDWREYQEKVAAFFRRQGCVVEVEKKVQGVRAKHEIDVYASFTRSGIKCTWIVECKLWKTKVPKEKVMALKSIVDDIGADRGIIVSEVGFQSGTLNAVRDSNITLVTSLDDFERTTSTVANLQHLSYISEEQGASIFKFPDGSRPQHLLKYGNCLISANWGSGTISIIDPKNRTIVRTIDLDNYEAKSPVTGERIIRKYPPGNMAIAEGKLFVGQVFSEFLLVIDIETQSIVKRIYLPGGGEGQIAASPDQKTLYFASNKENQFYVIDSATYKYKTVSYPSIGRGCMSISTHPNGKILYIGIQRGGRLNGKSYFGGNCFLAIYDLKNSSYLKTLYLAEIINGRSDDATPACIEIDPEAQKIYVGMFQSLRGICVIDANTNEVVKDIRFLKNGRNEHFEWVDPLSVKIDGNRLISLNRNNRELVILDKDSYKPIRQIYLGEAPNGPRDMEVIDSEIVVRNVHELSYATSRIY